MTRQQDLDRRRHLDVTISSNLSEHPLYSMTLRYRMRSYLLQKLVVDRRERSVRIRYGEMRAKVEQYANALQGEVEPVRMIKDKNLRLNKDSVTSLMLKESTELSMKPWRLRELPTLLVTLMQKTY